MLIHSINDIVKNTDGLSNNDLLYESSMHGYFDGIKLALEKGANVHYLDDIALYYSIYHKFFENAKYLISQGANIHVNNDEILKRAIYYDNFISSIFIIEMGGDLNAIKNCDTKTKFIIYMRNIKMYKIYDE